MNRDQRYNRSKKGRARDKRREQMAKHTPGPWQVTEFGNVTGPSKSIGSQGGVARVAIAEIHPAMTEGERAANACLIAAAPVLLAELRGMLNLLASLESCGNTLKRDGQQNAIKRLDATIRNATGEGE